MPAEPAATARTRLRRMHEKAVPGVEAVRAMLDALPLAHVGYVHEGLPVVTPTLQWRMGDRVYWHGSSASRMIKAAAGAQVCLTATALDGMVLARSGLEHSVNYRSVMVFGETQLLRDPQEKTAALRAMMERLFPGRWGDLRPMTAQELKATAVLSLPIGEASVKVDATGPADPEEDTSWPVWAGVLPLSLQPGTPRPAEDMDPGLALPDYLKAFRLEG